MVALRSQGNWRWEGYFFARHYAKVPSTLSHLTCSATLGYYQLYFTDGVSEVSILT